MIYMHSLSHIFRVKMQEISVIRYWIHIAAIYFRITFKKKYCFCSMLYRMCHSLSASKSVMYRYVCYF